MNFVITEYVLLSSYVKLFITLFKISSKCSHSSMINFPRTITYTLTCVHIRTTKNQWNLL